MATSIRASKDLQKGHKLTIDDIQYMAPDDGLPPSQLENVVGKELKSDLKVESNILLDNLN